ncbi:OLC1v1024049C1 [Oldenlandia corymbosa var. corymbosa]|uniref:OLC1v1024049C1 n=1 Tax=Oldenlandia corymbosa var. corymbosa TaxID=529605 RepID=A0AAV1C478_OLDCO|nr:OLC1v1024049C1 [Oldenlandia corymbosa var. corymbosa]
MRRTKGSLASIFREADYIDKLLMFIGFLGAVGDGISLPSIILFSSKILNDFGRATAGSQNSFPTLTSTLLLCYVAFAQWIACFSERQASRLRVRYLKAVLRQEVGYFDIHVKSTADIIESVSKDCLVIQEVISEKVPVFLMHLSTFVGGYAAAFIMSWRLAIVGFPLVVLLVVPGMVYGRVLMGIARNMREDYSKAGVIVEQAISSVRTVYSFVGETKTVAEYSAALEGTFKLGLRQGLAKGVANGCNGIVFAIWSFMCYYGSRMVMYHGAKGGTVYSVGGAMAIAGLSLGQGLPNVRYLSEASAAVERMMEIIKGVPKIDIDNMEGEILPNVSGGVELKEVKFAYPSRPESITLEGFNLNIPAGRTVALVGKSGSGKSTVIALLQRFYDPIGGEIYLDEVAISKLQLRWLRSQMGLVSQEPSLFATTIKENILFGKEDATIEEIVEAAKASNAHNFINQLPQGYDTQVGERGIQISGVQKQRIAIARAIIKSPKILLLDEATSALDMESERLVQKALDKAAVGRSTIMIGHRLSTIRNADLIAVVQDGQVMEIGSHDQLIARDDEKSLYTSLIRHAASDGGNSVSNLDDSKRDTTSRRSRLSVDPVGVGDSAGSSSNRGEKNVIVSRDDQTTPAVPAPPSFGRLLSMNSPEWRQALAGCLSALLFGAIQPAYAYVLGSMIWVFFLPDHEEMKRKIEIYALCFLGFAALSLLINICQHYNFAAMGEHLTKRIRERMLSKILTFDLGWFDKDENATVAICSRLANDAHVVRSLVGDRMSLLVQTVSMVTISFAMGIAIAWRLALVMITVQPLVIICYYWRRVLFKTMSRKCAQAREQSGKIAAEEVSNLRTVVAFNSQSRILHMLAKQQESPRRESIRQSWFAGIGLGTSNSLVTLSWNFHYWYGGKLMGDGLLKTKEFLETFIILVSTERVIANAGAMTNDLAKGSDAVSSVFAILDKHSAIEPQDPKGEQIDKITGGIELRDVDFAYPSRPEVMIFEKFCLRIEAGESTALVGQSGSGKSTVINLIERFYDPLAGAVNIDGRDIKSYHLRSLRQHIALVSQEPVLFAGTIRQNVAFGGSSEHVDESEIIEASKIANAHDFITGLKDGYNTW